MASLIDLTCNFLALLNQQHNQTDPRVQELETKLRARDRKALQLMQELKCANSPAAMICTKEMIESIRAELGAYIQNDQECLDTLNRFKDASQCPETQNLLDRAINFVQIPSGSELGSDLPFLDLLNILEEFPDNDDLIECIKYMGTMVDPNSQMENPSAQPIEA